MDIRFPDVECRGILKISGNIFFRYRGGGDILFLAAVDDLIVYIGKILHVGYLIAPVLKITAHGIKYHNGPGVAQVNIIIGGRPANVHGNLPLF
ncbi:hypothetical protein SDC9_165002 [bioreactor metagenome]|uniref:Uncharacterized protein n=1 Tax=bioreactor metagenome TaxID=1076179 RepID=A0A645FT57_9ZZZZ